EWNVPEDSPEIGIDIHDSMSIEDHWTEQLKLFPISNADLPLTFSIYPTGEDLASEFRIAAFAFHRTGTFNDTTSTTLRSRVVPGEARVIRIMLERSCRMNSCGNRSCRGGECVPEAVDPETYPLWDGSDPAM
ncbi:MAG: hypothetical protein AAGF12_09445, partial [Myxococcota bacterium]